MAWHGTRAEALGYLDEFDVPYPSGLDSDERVYRAYGFRYQPNTVLVTRSGRIFRSVVGGVGADELRGLLDRLIAEP